MATFASISAVGVSLERYLNACFSEDPPLGPITAPPASPAATRALLVRTEDFDPNNSGLQRGRLR
jgi:hypothetical protein